MIHHNKSNSDFIPANYNLSTVQPQQQQFVNKSQIIQDQRLQAKRKQQQSQQQRIQSEESHNSNIFTQQSVSLQPSGPRQDNISQRNIESPFKKSNIHSQSTTQSLAQIQQAAYLKLQENREIQLVDEKIQNCVIEQAKHSSRKIGNIHSYAANTHQGLFRGYNEDRVSIILNINKPQNKQCDQPWPKCSFFAVYDGHGGNKCADFLRDQLHQNIIKDDNFPSNPKEALRRGIAKSDEVFLKQAEQNQDRSGSTACVVLIVEDMIYVANVGDCRAVLSVNGGQQIVELSKDHKPFDEKQRIQENGGRIYQVANTVAGQSYSFAGISMQPPWRVFPGKLSVSRTIGDLEAKSLKYGGNPNVVISEPDIVSYKIRPEFDFIVLGCDGIFDRIESNECVQMVWNNVNAQKGQESNVHKVGAGAVDHLMKQAILRKTLDNITVVLISLSNLERIVSGNESAKSNDNSYEIYNKTTSNQSKKISDNSMTSLNTNNTMTTGTNYLVNNYQNPAFQQQQLLQQQQQSSHSHSQSQLQQSQSMSQNPITNIRKTLSSRQSTDRKNSSQNQRSNYVMATQAIKNQISEGRLKSSFQTESKVQESPLTERVKHKRLLSEN